MSASRSLPELVELESLIERVRPHARVECLAEVECTGTRYPVWSMCFGAREPSAPAIAFVGGVHGLERIGAQVVLAYLRTLSVRLAWDRVLHDTLEHVRLVFVPLVNPGGMALGKRHNPRGVDLMRNGVRAPDGRGTFLLGGQRFTPRLPWYAGTPELGLEPESAGLVRLITRELFPSRAALAIDCHSGFGMVDRLWFPYARTRKPFPNLAEVVGIKRLLDATLPHHVYQLEPQAQAYTIEGDLWDHLYDLRKAAGFSGAFVPFTLEMGSWAWVRKNPWQVWEPGGSFNPVLPHRLKRTLRRHLPLFDLLLHAIRSHEAWLVDSDEERIAREHEAWLSWPRT